MIRKIYKSIRKILSHRQQAKLSKCIFLLTKKPFTKKDNIDPSIKFPNSENGGLILSADFEMAWAWRYAKTNYDSNKLALKMAKQARQNIPKQLSLFEEYNIPVTWATVGHLFLEKCREEDHRWMQRIPHFENKYWNFTDGDWFDHDPYSEINKDNSWYGSDLIELILKSPVKHEIACHTFSHIDCSYQNCPPEVLYDELKACKEVSSKWGINMKSLIFPGGTSGNYEILKKYGYTIYRKNLDFDLAYPFRDKLGLLITPSSSGFGRGNNWSSDYYFYRYKKIIDKAIMTNTIAHFWFHPSVDTWTIKNVFTNVLKYANLKRKQGKLWIGTMVDISEHIKSKGL